MLVGEDTGLHPHCYGTPEARTPNIDRLAASGVRCTHAYSVAPVCAPARSCMITGVYPWSLGTHHMRSKMLQPPRLFTHELQECGYHVSWPTKTDFNFDPPVDFATDTESWWDKSLPDKPFFGFRNFASTHESDMWDCDPEGLGKGYPTQIDQLPEDQRTDPAAVRVPAYLPDVPEVRRELARYFDMLAIQDMQIGQTLDAIDRAGVADHTVVIYMTDHGRGLAREKRYCYDAGLHLPLIIRWPGRIKPGSVNNQVVSWVDLAPTILSIAGCSVPETYQGQSIFSTSRTHAVSGRDRMDEQFDRVRTITDGRFRYIRNDFPHLPWSQRNWYQESQQTMQALRRMDADGTLIGSAKAFMRRPKPPEELYDAVADPDMVHNLIDDPDYVPIVARLRDALKDELRRFGDLGMVDETDLIARGLVADLLTDDYRKRIQPLPEPYHSRTGLGCLTMNEAQASRPAT